MTPKVTIITGYYNREEYVDYSVKSLLEQTSDKYEIIIFDDCSTDNTYEKLKNIVNNDKRVTLIKHLKNTGFVRGLTNAMKIAKGSYVAIHGSGDISKRERIEKQTSFLDKHPEIHVVGCHYINKDTYNKTEKYIQHIPFHTRESLFSTNPLSHGEVMFRKEIYDKVGGYRNIFKYSQDKDLWLRMSEHGGIGVIQEVLYERIINYEGVSYKVDKLIDQKKYSHLANIVNRLSKQEQDIILKKVEESGINSVISSNDEFIQKNMFKMFNVLFVKNKLTNTDLFIKNSNGWTKNYYICLSKIYDQMVFRRLANSIYKVSTKSY